MICKIQKRKNLLKRFSRLALVILLISVAFSCKPEIADTTIDKVTKELQKATTNYDELGEFHCGLAKVREGEKFGFIDKLGVEIIPCRYDEVEDFQNEVCVVKQNGKYGIIDKYGDFILSCEYDQLSSFKNDSLISIGKNDRYGLVNPYGDIIIPMEYEECNCFIEDLATIRKDGKYGCVDKDNKIIIPCMYDELYNGKGFSEGLLGVKKDDMWGYIDKTGTIVIPFRRDNTGAPFDSGLAPIMSFNNEGLATSMTYMDTKGKPVSKFVKGLNCEPFRDGYAVVQLLDKGEGLIDSHGNQILPQIFSLICWGFDKDYVRISFGPDRDGFAKLSDGSSVIKCEYEISSFSFSEGFVPAKKNDKFGFLDQHGEVAIPFRYNDASDFSEGFAVVQKYGKYGYVDRSGTDTFN